MQASFISLMVTVAVLGICGTIMYGCKQANESYYTAQQSCISNGGSWMPNNNGAGNYSAMCLKLK